MTSLFEVLRLSYGLHFPDCGDTIRYQRHIDFWLSSLQVLYGGPIVWRSVSPPQFDADLHSHPPTGCHSATNVTRLDAAVRSTLQARGATLVNTATVVAGWANATADTMHYDGGVLRQWHAHGSGSAVAQCTSSAPCEINQSQMRCSMPGVYLLVKEIDTWLIGHFPMRII